jgi:OmpA-OmpF porin, OOP family
MSSCTTVFIRCAVLAALSVHMAAYAQDVAAHGASGPYVGAAWGVAFGDREIDDKSSSSSNDEALGRSAKLYAGYQLNEHCGVQVGYVRLRRLNQNTGVGATLVERSVSGRSVYLAGTGRLPLGSLFALTGKLGVSFGKVNDGRPAANTASLLGSRTSLLVGTGAEYLLNDHVALTVELESYGRISSQVKGSTLSAGARYAF